MQRQSPPKHRHDGTSPLPLAMDWSPPPKKWDGKDTVWPHDPRAGWSYCVTIPSWVILPKSRDAEGIVVRVLFKFNDFTAFTYGVPCFNVPKEQFYRVQVGIQSPEGISNARRVLRRFSDFMKLFTELKRSFPKKNLPPAPPKHILRLNSSKQQLEERRCSLEEWMGKLLSDINLSRSVPVASFLELEAAARSSFHDINQQTLEAKPSGNSAVSFQQSSGVSVVGGSSSETLDYGSDNAYETSELGTPSQGKDNSSEIGTEDLVLDHDLTTSMETLVKYGMSNKDNGLFMGNSILEQHEMLARKENSVTGRDTFHGNTSGVTFLSGDRVDLLSEAEHGRLAGHARRLSSDSVGSDKSSIRGSEISNIGVANSLGDGSLDLVGGAEALTTMEIRGRTDLQFPSDIQVVLSLDQRLKMNRVLMNMQRRLATAKTDMEDLIARLNQEIAVKEYLTTKVKDLEIELETTKQRSKENLQQAILTERERFTQMQWDMEELRRKSLEMESKLRAEQDEKVLNESTKTSAVHEKELLVQELDSTKEKLVNLQKLHEELLVKSKADTKVLVKEVKSLRNSQTELKQELGQSLKEKSAVERILQNEKLRAEHAKNARAKLLHECEILRHRLQECSVNIIAEEEDKLNVDSSSLSDALGLLTTSDNRIGLLLAEAQLLAQDDENAVAASHNINDDDLRKTNDEIRKMLTDIFIDNARLRKQVNSVTRCALKTTINSEKVGEEETPSRKTVLNKFLER